MANWKEPKNDYTPESQVVPEIFNTLAENERYLQEKKITTEQVQDAEINITQASSRVNLEDKGTVKGFFGKIKKWFADLRALAFKGTVGTADIDNLAVTSAKIGTGAVTSAKLGSNAVTAAKIATNAVETAKIKDGAVTDAKISTVSASKITGLHKVATSGSYNDLKDKPSGGGLSLEKFEYNLRTSYPLKEGLFLCYVRWHNRASIYGVSGCGLLSISKWTEAGCYSGVSAVYEGDSIKIQIECCVNESDNTMSFRMYESQDGNGNYAPNDSGYFDGGAEVVLYKLGDTPAVAKERNIEEAVAVKTWKLINGDHIIHCEGGISSTCGAYVEGLKKGDEIKLTVMTMKLNMDYNNEAYWYNALDANAVYGFIWNGSEWQQVQYDGEYVYEGEKQLNSSTPFTADCGLVDYSTPNKVTLKISCQQDNNLTVEISDQAGCYIETMLVYNIYAKR